MKRRKFRDALSARKPMALEPQAFDFLFDLGSSRENELRGDTAIVYVDGPLEHKTNFFFDSYEAVQERFEAAMGAKEASRVLLVIDSPGGDVSGCFDAVRAMRASTTKPVVAFANESAFSAAYALACVADEIYLPASGGVGSVGVIGTLVDITGADAKYGEHFELITSGKEKAYGNPHISISDDARAKAQELVNMLADQFFEVVSEARPLSSDQVKGLEAGCFHGEDAVTSGLADGIISLTALIDSFTVGESVQSATNEDDSMKNKKQAATIDPNAAAVQAAIDAQTASLKASTEAVEEDEKERDSEEEATTVTVEVEEDEKEKDTEEEDDGEEDEEAAGDEPETAASARSLKMSDLLEAVRTVTGKSTLAQQIGAVHALAGLKAENAKLVAKLGKQKATSYAAKVAAAVDAGCKSGKITPAQKAFWNGLASKAGGLDTLAAFLKDAPTLASATPVSPEDAPSAPSGKPRGAVIAGTATITESDRKVAKVQNLDPQKIADLRAQQESAVK